MRRVIEKDNETLNFCNKQYVPAVALVQLAHSYGRDQMRFSHQHASLYPAKEEKYISYLLKCKDSSVEFDPFTFFRVVWRDYVIE